eukprot:4270110-Karenia_brevis.AAC.1
MGPQPGKGGYKKLVNGPTSDHGGYKCWTGNKAGRNVGVENVEMTSPSASLELQGDAEEVGGQPSKTTKKAKDKAGRIFGVESVEMTSPSASLELQVDAEE